MLIHILEDGKVHIYSRNSEDNTSKYPDIIGRIHKSIKDHVKSAVIDSEAVAWDEENKQILPFQVLSTRKRKVFIDYLFFHLTLLNKLPKLDSKRR